MKMIEPMGHPVQPHLFTNIPTPALAPVRTAQRRIRGPPPERSSTWSPPGRTPPARPRGVRAEPAALCVSLSPAVLLGRPPRSTSPRALARATRDRVQLQQDAVVRLGRGPRPPRHHQAPPPTCILLFDLIFSFFPIPTWRRGEYLEAS